MTLTHDETAAAWIKIAVSLGSALFGVATLQWLALLLAVVFSASQLYVLWRDKIIRKGKNKRFLEADTDAAKL
jgi:hypothetical protein